MSLVLNLSATPYAQQRCSRQRQYHRVPGEGIVCMVKTKKAEKKTLILPAGDAAPDARHGRAEVQTLNRDENEHITQAFIVGQLASKTAKMYPPARTAPFVDGNCLHDGNPFQSGNRFQRRYCTYVEEASSRGWGGARNPSLFGPLGYATLETRENTHTHMGRTRVPTLFGRLSNSSPIRAEHRRCLPMG